MNIRNFWIFFSLIMLQTFSFQVHTQLPRPEGFWHKVGNYITSTTPFLGPIFKLAYPESQREPWSTGLIAEPVATVTNAGLLAAAYAHKDTAPVASATLATAGIISAISHAVPYNILNIADKIAAASSVLGVIYDAKLYKPEVLKKTLSNPVAAGLLATTGVVYGLDTYIPRSGIERKDYHKYLHGAWHILAALLAHTSLKLNPPETNKP